MTTTINDFVAIKSASFDFHISKYQVTMKAYLAFAKETNTHYPEWLQEDNKYNLETGSDDLYEDVNFEEDAPIVGISWEDAKAYCAWLSQKDSNTYRLPTETEWEYACKADTTSLYSCDETKVSEYAWYYENAFGEAHAVGTKKPNPWGLYDMHGNVWEWCEDTWTEVYEPNSDKASSSEERRVLRGGSWFDAKANASSTARHKYAFDFRYVDVGFRVVFS